MKKIISYMKSLEWAYLIIFLLFVYLQVALSLKIPECMTATTDQL